MVQPFKVEGIKSIDPVPCGTPGVCGECWTDNSSSQPEMYAGTIIKVDLINFLCYDELLLPLNPKTNFIIGGSRERRCAIQTAIHVALGVKFPSLKDFIKPGSSACAIQLTLKNTGEKSYCHDKFGDEILIARTIIRGEDHLQLKSANGSVISSREEDLTKMLYPLNIRVSSMTIMSPSSEAVHLLKLDMNQRYSLFAEATQIDNIRQRSLNSKYLPQKLEDLISSKEKEASALNLQLQELKAKKETLMLDLNFHTEKEKLDVAHMEFFKQNDGSLTKIAELEVFIKSRSLKIAQLQKSVIFLTRLEMNIKMKVREAQEHIGQDQMTLALVNSRMENLKSDIADGEQEDVRKRLGRESMKLLGPVCKKQPELSKLLDSKTVDAQTKFQALLSLRGYKGYLYINHNKRELGVFAGPVDGTSKSMDATHLDDSEKAFFAMVLMLTLWQVSNHPFYFISEFDESLTPEARLFIVKSLLLIAHKKRNSQFICTTHYGISYSQRELEFDPSPRIKVFNLYGNNQPSHD